MTVSGAPITGNGVIPGEYFVDLALLMAFDDGGECGRQPCVGIDAVHRAGFIEPPRVYRRAKFSERCQL
jgi:hypothetical protein